MTFTTAITDSGARVWGAIEAADLEAACALIEQSMREAELVTAGNPGCEPRTEWTCYITDGYAECSLRAPGESDSAAWARATIEPQEPGQNYVQIALGDNYGEVTGLAFAQSDQAERWEFKVHLKTNCQEAK